MPPTINVTSKSSQKPPSLKPTCTSCAASKIKCSRDKPVCTRCKERGLTCDYVASRRAGRPCQSKKSSDSTTSTSRPQSNSSTLGSPPTQLSNVAGKETPAPTAIRSTTNDFPSTSKAADLSNTPAMCSSGDLAPDLDDAFNTFEPFETFTIDPFPLLDGSSTFVDDLSNSIDPLPMQDLFNSQCTMPIATAIQNDSAGCTQKCDCLSKAMGFLAELRSVSKSSIRQTSICVPTTDTVIVRNRNILESTKKLLDCSCVTDEVLMVIFHLTMMQILMWYAAIVSDQSKSNDEMSNGTGSPKSHSSQEQVLKLPTTIDGYHLDGGDNDRMAAQLVLSELHNVHYIVNKLTSKLNNPSGLTSPELPGQQVSAGAMELDDAEGGSGISFISAQTMKLLQSDINKRLRTVSLRTVGTLQR